LKYIIIPLLSQPGIQRDGTQYDSKNYIDGQWCRFYKGRPRKMGGFKLISYGDTLNFEITNTLFSNPAQGNAVNIYMGRPSTVSVLEYDQNSVQINTPIDLTPEGFDAHPDNNWTFDIAVTTPVGGGENPTQYLLAHGVQNWNDISNDIPSTVYYAPVDTPTQLAPIVSSGETPFQVTGGILFVSPLIIAYSGGSIYWSVTVDTISLDNTRVLTNTKIINIVPARGSNQTSTGSSVPSLLVWSLNTLLRATFTTEGSGAALTATFSYQIIQNNISIISAKSIVEYNQVFYWVGENQFFYFNGIVNKLPNEMSTDWFFGGLNYDYRAKIFGVANPRYDEIMWFYPRGNSTECNACVIYNVRLEVWYDTFLSRSAAILPTTVSRPIMADSSKIKQTILTSIQEISPIWLHEIGFDQVIGNRSIPIDSYYQTHWVDLFSNNPENSKMIYTRRICPNINQVGSMSIYVSNLLYPDDPNPVSKGPFFFEANTSVIDDITSQGTLVSFRFESNVSGGFYQAGKTLLWYTEGDEAR
jgi:hypothetical protein